MKNISRILALVLALTMVIGAFASVSAAKATWYNDAVEYLESIGVADIGTKAGTKITRAEFALMVAKIDSTWVNTAWWDENNVLANTVVFKDQADTDKAHRAAICYAYQRALIAGDGDGNFRPNATIDLAEASVVIVRLMGFQNDVPENGDQWQYNWMYAANKYCHAFNSTFMSNVDTVNPDYELSYGEAAYLLATILNWGSESDDVTCLTKKGENLGKNFPWGGSGTSSDTVIVDGLTMDTTNQVVLGASVTLADGTVLDGYAGLYPITGSGSVSTGYTVAVDELEKLVRVSLGLSATRDTSGEALDTFNLGDYVQNGTLLKVKRVDDSVTAVTLFSEEKGTKSVSTTVLVAKATTDVRTWNYDGSVKNPGKYPKLANATGSNDTTPELPLAYTSATYPDASGATKYTHEISFAGSKLVYKGASDKAVEYTVVSSTRSVAEDELVVIDAATGETLTAAEAKALIPNTAKGQAWVEFYDVDNDGYYDIAVVIASSEFGADVVTSVASGKVTIKVKSNYQTINVANVSSGIISAIETSGKKTIDGKEYFVCTVATLGNIAETKTVYIPVPVFDADGNETYANRAESVSLTYAVAGATNTISVDSKAWTPFLDTLKNSTTGTISDILTPATFKGLVYNKAVSYVLASDIDSTATGDAANVVVYLADTAAASAADTGFIVKVEKTETGDNTFKVTLASAKNEGFGSTANYADGAVLDARFSSLTVAVSKQNTYTDSAMPVTVNLNNVTVKEALTALGFDAATYMAREANYVAFSKSGTVSQTYAPVHQVSNILAKIAAYVSAAEDDTVYDKAIGNIDMLLAYCQLHGKTSYSGWDQTATAEEQAAYNAVTFAEFLAEVGCDKATFEALVKADLAKANEYIAIVKVADALRYTSTATEDLNTVSDGVKVVNDAGQYLQSVITSSAFGKVSGVKTYEVRASASYLWDIENYDAYHKIFASTTNAYQFQNAASGTKVTDADFIYVSILKDASNQRVLKYIDVVGGEVASTAEADVSITKNENMTITGKYTYAKNAVGVTATWTQYQSMFFLDGIDTKTVEKEAVAAIKAGEEEYTKETTTRVAKDPYYLKTPSASAKFEKRWSVANAKVTFTAVQKMSENVQTYVPVVDKTGAQLKVLTETEKAYWESQTTPDGMPYKVIDKLLYRVNTTQSVPMVDENGNPVVNVTYTIDYTDLTWTDEAVSDADFAKVSTVSSRALDPTADKGNYLPGYYEVTFDGTTYMAEESATIVVMTPDTKTGNLSGSTTTVKAFTEAGKDLFVTYEQVTTVSGDLTVLGVIGEYVDGTVAPTPDDDGDTPNYKIVYLAKAGTTLEATEYGKDIVVKSTYSAVSVPAGDEFGSIYYRYSTYAEAKYAATIDATIPVGYYAVTADGEIKGSTGIAKTGAILSVDAKGNLKVDLYNDGKTVVDGTNFKWEFFYVDFDGNYKKASDSTAVTLVNYNLAIKTQVATLEAKITTAQAEYDKIVAEEVATGEKRTAAKIAAKEAIVAAEQALADYKTSAEAKNLNGTFWGTANSPAYTYVVTYKYTYQMEPERITFQYIVVDGTYCVLVNSILQ